MTSLFSRLQSRAHDCKRQLHMSHQIQDKLVPLSSLPWMGDLIQADMLKLSVGFLKPVLNGILTDAIAETHIIRLINSKCKKGRTA